MHGNVFEWCADRYDKDYYSSSGSKDPQVPAAGSKRVYRGGGLIHDGVCCRSADRFMSEPGFRCDYLGFRVAMVGNR